MQSESAVASTNTDAAITTVCLQQHGWKGCKIPLSLEDLDSHLPDWRHLQALRPPETYGSRTLQLPYEPLNGDEFPAYQMGTQLDVGSYGRIMKAQRAIYKRDDPTHPTQLLRVAEFEEVACKINDIPYDEYRADLDGDQETWCAEEVQAILHEASLHALAYHTLAARGFPHTIPRLYEVFAIPRTPMAHISSPCDISGLHMGMELICGETLHNYFAKHLPKSDKPRILEANDRLIIEILIQLAIYLDILQTDLRFNHRDLKINNVLRRRHTGTWYKALQHPCLSRPWIAFHDLVIIDFGFACVACDDTPKSLVQAGSWFKMTHDCLKRGRDIALFLHCLQACYPLEERISPTLLQVLQDAMTIRQKNGMPVCLLTTHVDNTGRPDTAGQSALHFGNGIYKLLRNEDVEVAGCAPHALLKALDALRVSIAYGPSSSAEAIKN